MQKTMKMLIELPLECIPLEFQGLLNQLIQRTDASLLSISYQDLLYRLKKEDYLKITWIKCNEEGV